VNDPRQAELLDAVAPTDRAGFRLRRLEVYNWGTFDRRVWALEPGGNNALLTGDIGSGKSTLVDALTTLLVPPAKISYNKAAGAEARERSLRTYVLGVYKAERGESGLAPRQIGLRDHDSYSVILAQFRNEAFGHDVTLAQVFWITDAGGQPNRLYVVADAALSIAEHFVVAGGEIKDLRRRLRAGPKTEVADTFPPYGDAFRRRFGIANPQALDLFHQTVSMKSVGDLTDFVREHMLEPFPVEERVRALGRHFQDLQRAHEAVLKAKDQVARLQPIVADCLRHGALGAEIAGLRAGRDALHAFFASHKAALLVRRLAGLDDEIARAEARLAELEMRRHEQQLRRDDLKRAISANGGDRLERLRADIAARTVEKAARQAKSAQYDGFARAADLPAAGTLEAFVANQRKAEGIRAEADQRFEVAQNRLTERSVDFQKLKGEHEELVAELASLRQRRSNIPSGVLRVRAALCQGLGLDEEALPFAGELVRVRDDERSWEGAAERLLHGFALAVLVRDAHYADVARWVNQTHLGDRLVYFRVREARGGRGPTLGPDALARKLEIKPDSDLYGWLEAELARRFDHAATESMDAFRREKKAITRTGQIKGGDDRHEKDDRHRIDDRSRYVLGWSNEGKIAALERQRESLEARLAAVAGDIAGAQRARDQLRTTLDNLSKLAVFREFREIDWRGVVAEIAALEEERRRLEAASDVLRALEQELSALEAAAEETHQAQQRETADRAAAMEKRRRADEMLAECRRALAEVSDAEQAARFPRLEAARAEALGEHALTVESCDNREKDVRDWLQARIDAEDKNLARLQGRIVQAMEAYRQRYPADTREADAAVEAASEYQAMLERLHADDLPRFEARFKELLNENTIREIANFQSQLAREAQLIKERIEAINQSLHAIDYNPGRYIELLADPTPDPEIRDFRADLRLCVEGALGGADEAAYSEGKFLEVKRIIERLEGREGTAEADRRWARKVTDVRQWCTFSASERWREDRREHEHYRDSGGKSGGQKEKLAYTVLAASLAYQFGLEWGVTRTRSFRFVVIDEAFGRGSDESTRYGLELFAKLNLQLLIVTPLQKIRVIEPFVRSVGFVHNEEGQRSMLRNLTIEEYRAELAARSA
jgi:uncharacterized protein YPO0396